MKTIPEFQMMKAKGEKITLVTCYDYTLARIVNSSHVDAIIVGDSAAMVMHGYHSTIPATLEMMELHVQAVAKGAPDKFLIADMPFLAHRKGLPEAMRAVDILMKAGASAVKIEGAKGHLEIITHIVESGIPVMGHLGMTPQSVYQFGGYKLQGREKKESEGILADAKFLESAGVFALVLELIPASLAEKITRQLSIPTIGIGAGPRTTGQVLVLQDLLGMNPEFNPKFLRTYLNGYDLIQEALNRYTDDVKNERYPAKKESF